MAASSASAKGQDEDLKKAPFKIAVMTSGGDSQGMNSAVRSVVKMAIHSNCHAYVIREGWEGLVMGNLNEQSEKGDVEEKQATDDKGNHETIRTSFGHGEALREGTGEEEERGFNDKFILRVGFDDVRGFQSEGGTLIGTARCAEFRERSGRLKAANNLITHGIDGLVVVGGDGSLTGADKLRGEWGSLVGELLSTGKITKAQATRYAHLKIVGLVGSIDNDMALTDNTIGFTSALARSCEALDSISSTASSHRRGFVFCCMGRHCGAIALMAAIATGSDYVFVPEAPPTSGDWREEMCQVLKKHRDAGKRKTIVVIAEGAIDRDLNPITPDDVKACLSDRLGLDTRVTILGHVARGGKPTAEDRLLATAQGVEAVKALLEAKPETPSYIIGIREGKIQRIPLMEAVEQTQQVAKYIESKQFDKALALRDLEFQQGLSTFNIVSRIDDSLLLPKEKRLRIGLMCVGAPAGGQNAAIRTAARYCLARGHEPLAIQNGFPGLVSDEIYSLSWLYVDNWATRGGTELGTNRKTPDTDYEGIAKSLERNKIQALMIIGGFEAFLSVKMLYESRPKHKAFNLPIIQLPATLSSNVPLTESIGFSTSLNEVVNAADILRGSARASRARLFLLSCQGGKAGQLAVHAALASGAAMSYEPETGISLQQLDADCSWLQRRFQLDAKGKTDGRLIIVSDKASDALDLDTLSRVFQQSGQGTFSVRSSSLGHLCQGSVPSPIDRCRGARLAHRACVWIEENVDKTPSEQTAGVMCINATKVDFVSAVEMSAASDFKYRRPKDVTWKDAKGYVDLMAGRSFF